MSTAIECTGLGKLYDLGRQARPRTLREVCWPWSRPREPEPRSRELWALRDVSFRLEHGEVLGIVGRNGAGKSTLLKVLARITAPTTGHARIFGRIGSLLEVGTGFHSELTGRENIFLGGAVLGLRRHEIQRKFDEIVDFSEAHRFLDTPLKHYSSGMQMRLAFAVAAHLEPEILLIDEVLAVGDASFQKKCLGKMAEVAARGRTIIFVSHNLVAVENLCSRTFLMDNGRIVRGGRTSEVIAEYLRASDVRGSSVDLAAVLARGGSGEIRLEAAEVLARSDPSARIRSGDGFRVRLRYRCRERVRRLVFSTALYTQMGVAVFAVHTTDQGLEINELQGTGWIELEVERANLLPGRYLLHFAVGDEGNPHRFDHLLDAAVLDVEGADVYGSGRVQAANWSLVFLPCRWMLARDAS